MSQKLPLKEKIIMFTKRLPFLFLFLAVLSSFSGRAMAQLGAAAGCYYLRRVQAG